jgi:hypothetical protein
MAAMAMAGSSINLDPENPQQLCKISVVRVPRNAGLCLHALSLACPRCVRVQPLCMHNNMWLHAT